MERETNQMQSGSHKVVIEERGCIKITGVEDVESFEESEVTAYTNMGVMTLRGSDFKINKLNVESGELVINGELDSLAYSGSSGEKAGFFGRLFK